MWHLSRTEITSCLWSAFPNPLPTVIKGSAVRRECHPWWLRGRRFCFWTPVVQKQTTNFGFCPASTVVERGRLWGLAPLLLCMRAHLKLWLLIFPVRISESVYFYHGWKALDAVGSFNPLEPKSLTSIWEMLWHLTVFLSMQRQKEGGSEHQGDLFIFCPYLEHCLRV